MSQQDFVSTLAGQRQTLGVLRHGNIQFLTVLQDEAALQKCEQSQMR